MNKKLWEIGSELDAIGLHIIEAHGQISEGMEAMLNDVSLLFRICIAISVFYFLIVLFS